jgi:hypothetical protein
MTILASHPRDGPFGRRDPHQGHFQAVLLHEDHHALAGGGRHQLNLGNLLPVDQEVEEPWPLRILILRPEGYAIAFLELPPSAGGHKEGSLVVDHEVADSNPPLPRR